MATMPVADPVRVSYSREVAVALTIELNCETLGLREMGVVSLEMHRIVNRVVGKLLWEHGYRPPDGDGLVEDPLTVCLGLVQSKKGSWIAEVKVWFKTEAAGFARQLAPAVAGGLLVAMISGSTPVNPEDQTWKVHQASGVSQENSICDVSQNVKDMAIAIAKTNKSATLRIVGTTKDGQKCSLVLKLS